MTVVIAIALLAAAALIAILAWDSHRQANRRRQRLDDRRDAAVAAELWRLLNEQTIEWCGICRDGERPCTCDTPHRFSWREDWDAPWICDHGNFVWPDTDGDVSCSCPTAYGAEKMLDETGTFRWWAI